MIVALGARPVVARLFGSLFQISPTGTKGTPGTSGTFSIRLVEQVRDVFDLHRQPVSLGAEFELQQTSRIRRCDDIRVCAFDCFHLGVEHSQRELALRDRVRATGAAAYCRV